MNVPSHPGSGCSAISLKDSFEGRDGKHRSRVETRRPSIGEARLHDCGTKRRRRRGLRPYAGRKPPSFSLRPVSWPRFDGRRSSSNCRMLASWVPRPTFHKTGEFRTPWRGCLRTASDRGFSPPDGLALEKPLTSGGGSAECARRISEMKLDERRRWPDSSRHSIEIAAVAGSRGQPFGKVDRTAHSLL